MYNKLAWLMFKAMSLKVVDRFGGLWNKRYVADIRN